jgi:nitrite reductase/ring-hydroxylating ferredoxin subunit
MTSVRAGSRQDLVDQGRLLTKVGSLPVVVLWHGDRAYALEDRCPHMGFPLRRGTVESGLLTCHWHHARFDLESGCTLDLWADDAVAFDVAIDGDDVIVSTRARPDAVAHLHRRLREGLEDNLWLVVAKAVLGLLEAGVDADEIVRTGVEFGVDNRAAGWGTGLTVLVAMANALPHLDADDRALALVHGLTFLANDTAGHAPRFPVSPLATAAVPLERLADWYRRFVDTRSSDAAERVLGTAIATGDLEAVERMMFAAVTDHVFVDGGHTLDFTNKAFEALAHTGRAAAADLLPTLVRQTTTAARSEEASAWRYPDDLAGLVTETVAALPGAVRQGATRTFDAVAALGWDLLAEDPRAVTDALLGALRAGATPEQAGRAVAYAAALRIARFHTQNEHTDWDTVHHSFTAANALHHALARTPSPELLRGLVHGALAVYLDRFLNVPAARLPDKPAGDLAELEACWDVQGAVDEAGAAAYGHVRATGDPAPLRAALGRALLEEDAGFHWYQVYEAGVRQSTQWPDGSEEQAIVLAALARWLSAHTPTRREQTTTFRIARRLRRGEALYEEA